MTEEIIAAETLEYLREVEELYQGICDDLADEDGAIYMDMASCLRHAIAVTLEHAEELRRKRSAMQCEGKRIYRVKITYPSGCGPGSLVVPLRLPAGRDAIFWSDRERIPYERAFLSRKGARDRIEHLTRLGCVCQLEISEPITWEGP
jgi:hypothetical protein